MRGSDRLWPMTRCALSSRQARFIGRRARPAPDRVFLREEFGTGGARLAPVHLLTDLLSAGDMPRLYAVADAYVRRRAARAGAGQYGGTGDGAPN